MNEIKSPFIKEEKIYIDNIPLIRLKPDLEVEKLPTIIFYHGWGSSKEGQRMRAYMLGNLGFQVLIPDSINHGERSSIDYDDSNNLRDYFWDTVVRSMEESEKILEFAIENLDADIDRIGVSGHSMGGFISSGIFTHNDKVKAGVILNGSCDWSYFNQIAGKMAEKDSDIPIEDLLKEMEGKFIHLDPRDHMDKIKDRPILLLNGGADRVVPVEGQKQFYARARKVYSDKRLIKLIEYNYLDHFVTTNMMEDTLKWFMKYL